MKGFVVSGSLSTFACRIESSMTLLHSLIVSSRVCMVVSSKAKVSENFALYSLVAVMRTLKILVKAFKEDFGPFRF